MLYRNYRAIKLGYRSGLEAAVADQLQKLGVTAEYESIRVPYEVPATLRHYTPDYILPNGIVVETKGRFTLDDRKKHLNIQEQYPDLDLRFVFSNPLCTIHKGSKTTYADWCDKYGFLYAHKFVPQAWVEETINVNSQWVVRQFNKNKPKKKT